LSEFDGFIGSNTPPLVGLHINIVRTKNWNVIAMQPEI